MKAVWNLTIDEYLEIVKVSKELGIKPGESMEPVFLSYMKIKGRKPEGYTELNKEEFLNELKSNYKNILEIDTNSSGENTYNFHKKQDDIDK